MTSPDVALRWLDLVSVAVLVGVVPTLLQVVVERGELSPTAVLLVAAFLAQGVLGVRRWRGAP